ncbi:MAG TPA: triose-phosphate isomerase [Bacillota bacterium]|nr:triose-phosphate isomerase [Bacillota bacterium]
MRKKVIAGNWKMNNSREEAKQFMQDAFQQLPTATEKVVPVVCAPFVHLSLLSELAKDKPLHIGAQSMHYEASGAYTGEISPSMLTEIGVSYVIIGHSERREYFNETDETVNKKVKAAFDYKLTPIVCVGETLEQRESGETKNHVAEQVKRALDGLSEEQISETIIAYEPIWAIGTGKTASSKDANDVCTHIRTTIAQFVGETIANKVVIQYGGSVNPDNVAELLAEENIDGALVGGASLDAQSFVKLVEAAHHA